MRNINFSYHNLIVDCNAIAENYKAIKNFVGENTKCSAVIKKNAYNLGSIPIMQSLSKVGCNEFFVHNLEEAIKLREISLTDKIYILDAFLPGEEGELIKYNVIPVVNSVNQFKLFNEFCKRDECKQFKKKFEIVLNIDTGLNCIGIPAQEAISLHEKGIFNQNVKVVLLLSDLVFSAISEHPFNQVQLKKMLELKKIFGVPVSLASSEGIYNMQPQFYCDMVRPGIALYGIDFPGNPLLLLKPTVHLKSKIVSVKELKENESIGYMHLTNLKAGSIIATVPIGYGDGIPSALGNKGSFYINGEAAPIIGRIAMDKTIIDVTKVNKNFVHIGADVEILGVNSSSAKFAAIANQLPHEIITAINSNIKRNYIF